MPTVERALTVDTSRTIRSILKRILTSHGYDVPAAQDGREALQALAGEAADLTPMCLDCTMRQMNGVELPRNNWAQKAFVHLSILVITTKTLPRSVEQAFAAGVLEHLMKPLTTKTFVHKLQLIQAGSVC